MDIEQSRIRERAHQIWEAAGRPEGQDAEHWSQAEREINGEQQSAQSTDSQIGETTETDILQNNSVWPTDVTKADASAGAARSRK